MFDIRPVLIHWQRFCAARDVLETNGHIVPDVHTRVDAVARAFPIVVDMTKDLERVTAGVIPGDHGVVAQRVRLLLWAVANLRQILNTGPWERLRWFQIMVADDEVLFCAGKLIEQLRQPVGVFRFWPMRKVANDPQRILGANHGPQVLHHNRIHVIGRSEGTLTELDDVLVPEMWVGCVPVGHVLSPSCDRGADGDGCRRR